MQNTLTSMGSSNFSIPFFNEFLRSRPVTVDSQRSKGYRYTMLALRRLNWPVVSTLAKSFLKVK